MLSVTLYGMQSLEFKHLRKSLVYKANKAGLDLFIKEESDVSTFIKEGIQRIPAVRIENETIVKSSKESIEEYIKTLSTTILKNSNFGTMKKIIVPIDFSEASENALIYGLNLAKELGGVIEVMHVYHPEVPTGEYLPDQIFTAEQKRRDKFEEYVKAMETKWYGEPTSQIVQSTFLVGFAADELIKASSVEREPLIVMGSSGSSAGVKKIMGSVSTKVALQAKCPVYIIPPDANYSPSNNVVYCSKEESVDSQLAPKVIDLIETSNPIIHLLHVGFEQEYRMEKLFELWNKHYPSTQIRDVCVPPGDEVRRIIEYCNRNNADLVIVARKERTFLQELFHKSVTKELVISASQPMLILHS